MMKANCPVIAVPSEAFYSKISNIAFASATGPADQQQIGQLTTFASELNASLHFVTVDTNSNAGIQNNHFDSKDIPLQFTDATVVGDSSVMKGLDSYVAKRKTDLLALYVPHRGLWDRIFHQSVSKQMALHTKVPMMAFHS